MSQQTNHAYEFGPFQLVPEERLLLCNGGAVALSPKDMDLLLVLVESRGRLLQKDELMKHLWPESFVEEANLSHHVFILRKVLNDHGDGVMYIETVPKHGYRFVVPVRDVGENEEPATATQRQSSRSGDGHTEENLSQIPDRLTSDSERKLGISPKPASPETLVNQESLTRRHWLMAVFAVFLLAVLLAALMTLVPTLVRWRRSQPQMLTTPPNIQSLAVLPFTNASGDPMNEYLSDGITESLINRLSRLPRLRVVARTTALRYKSQQVDPRTVGRQLLVSAVVTGRVLQQGDGLNVQVDLVDTADGSQLWGEQYSRKLTDIVVVQEEIAMEISKNLRLRLTPEEQRWLRHGYTENSEAYRIGVFARARGGSIAWVGKPKSRERSQRLSWTEPSGKAYGFWMGGSGGWRFRIGRGMGSGGWGTDGRSIQPGASRSGERSNSVRRQMWT